MPLHPSLPGLPNNDKILTWGAQGRLADVVGGARKVAQAPRCRVQGGGVAHGGTRFLADTCTSACACTCACTCGSRPPGQSSPSRPLPPPRPPDSQTPL